jgi:hypothetical protein
MKRTTTLLNLLAVTALAAASATAALADSDGRDAGYASGEGYRANRDDPGGGEHRKRHHERSVVRGRGDAHAYRARWRVINVTYDANGKLSEIQHVVPLYDMGIFGNVTGRLSGNGLRIVRVDAAFNRPDAQMPTLHYHFTQYISGAN